MLNNEQKVKECDANWFNSSNGVGRKNIMLLNADFACKFFYNNLLTTILNNKAAEKYLRCFMNVISIFVSLWKICLCHFAIVKYNDQKEAGSHQHALILMQLQ